MTGIAPPSAQAPALRALDDAMLAREAVWTERDRVEAEAFWERFGTPLLRSLLRADDVA